MSRAARPALRYGAIAAGIVAAAALVVAVFPWNTFRGPIASYLSDRVNRTVAIDGDLRVNPGWTTRIEIDDVSIANAAWSDLQPMAHARSIVLTFGLRSLLHVTPDTVQLVEPHVVLEKNPAGELNWHFGENGSSGTPRLGAITVDRGIIRYRDPTLRGDITVALQSTTPAPNTASALHFNGQGTLRGDSFTIEGQGHGVSELRQVDDPYQLAFDLHAGGTQIAFDGTLFPAAPKNLRGALQLRGPDLSELYPIVPSPLPWTPPYILAGDLTHENQQWDFQRIKGTVGDSDLAGDLRIDLSQKHPLTTADLSSRKFDYKDLGGFVGLPPGERGQKAQTPAQRQEARKRAATYRVLPDKPFDLVNLRDHDVDLQFRGTSVKWGALPLDNLVAHMTLKDGVLRFEPLDFGIADGHVVSHIKVDVSKQKPVAQGQIEVRRIELKRLFPKLASPRGSAGRFGGRAQFNTAGNSVAAMFAAANGEAAIAMRGGEMSTLQLVLTNLDLASAVSLLITGDQTAEINCAVAAVHATRGIVVPDLMVVDTSAELIHGQGSIDFRDEKYDLELKADSKKPSLLALRGPVTITGTFKTPLVHAAVGQAVARVAAAVGLGILAPPLALLPLIDLGNAPDSDCRALYQDARIASGATNDAPNAKIKPGNSGKPTTERVAPSH
ncbi:MAG: AsmA family protein [Casimicrobiaceae bacterium]